VPRTPVESRSPELTILMPCLNEALTVQRCVHKALAYLSRSGIHGEVLVADNGSADGSQELARAAGARVVDIHRKGYGAALTGGVQAAQGRFVIMADADDSYDLSDLDAFMERLRAGAQLVIGNRFKGGIRPGAMPTLNRYLGNPVLSFIGRRLFSASVGDFHCGIRGFDRDAMLGLDLRTSGMEFASEMIVKASLAGLRMEEVPTTLSPDGRGRAPHLRPWRDGLRHLHFMLLRSPRWLFLFPGMSLTAIGLLGAIVLTITPVRIPGIFTLDINALLYFSVAVIIGNQITFFGLFAITYAKKLRLIIDDGFANGLLKGIYRRSIPAIGLVLILGGSTGIVLAIVEWGHVSFGVLVPSQMMRLTIPSVSALALGVQILFGWLLLGFVEVD